MLIKAGAFLVLETGEYSDYSFHGPFRVLRDFDQSEVIAEYKDQWKPKDEWLDSPDTDGFMGWLSSQRYIEPVDGVVSWHIGVYGDLDAEITDEPPMTVAQQVLRTPEGGQSSR